MTDQCVNSTSTAAYDKMTTGTLAYTAKGVNRSLASGEGYDARTTRLVNKERDRTAYFESLAAKYPR